MNTKQLAAKDYLEQYGKAQRRVRQCQAQYERQLFLSDSIRSPSDNDGMPHGSGISKPTENKAIKLADKSIDVLKAKAEAFRILGEIFAVAYSVGGIESDVLIERYINLKDWEDIFPIVNYSESQTHRYHRAGLDKVAELLGL